MSTQTIITRKTDDVITNIATTTTLQGDNLLVTDSTGTYAIAGINENYNVYAGVETASNIVIQQYTYTTIDGFASIYSLSQTIQNVINNMTLAYEQDAYNTFTSTAFDGTTIETYACDQTSQARINGEVTTAIAVINNLSTEVISWKNVNQAQCVVWQPKNMVNLFNDLHKFETEKTDYLEALIVYINSLKDINLLNKVTYGMTIPTI